MKSTITIKNIEVSGIKLGEISIEETYTPGEAIEALFGLKKLTNEIISELPRTVEKLAQAYEAIRQADEYFEKEDKLNSAPTAKVTFISPDGIEIPEEIKAMALEAVMKKINGGCIPGDLFNFGR